MSPPAGLDRIIISNRTKNDKELQAFFGHI
jgi:hypothetical protein